MLMLNPKNMKNSDSDGPECFFRGWADATKKTTGLFGAV